MSVTRFQLLACLVCLVVFVSGFLLGSRYFSVEMTRERSRVAQLEEQRLQLDNQAAELVRLRATHNVESKALESLRQTIAGLDEQLSVQLEELMLYSKLLKTDASEDGLHIHNTNIKPGESPQSYVYSFVIRQQASVLNTISVVYSVEVNGQSKLEDKENNETVTYMLDDLDEAVDTSASKIKLKYFRVIEGVIKLPEGFTPQNLIISAWPEKIPSSRRQQVHYWPDAEG